MKWKSIISPKSVLLVLLLAAAVMAVPVSATDTPIFSIPGNTSVVFPNDGINTYSNVDYGPLNIPTIVTTTSNTMKQSGKREITSDIYNLVSFENIIPIHSNEISLPVTLYGNPYTLDLEKVNFSSDDAIYYGIDSYWGVIRGIPDSTVMLTFTSENTAYGSIRFENESITIKPVQNREYTLRTSEPLHIVYSEMDLLQPESPSDFCGVTLIDANHKQVNNLETRSPVGEYAYAYVNLLIVTDNEFYNLESNWIACAMDYLSEANYQYQRSDIKIVLRASYDVSMKDTFSANTISKYYPLDLAAIFYPNPTLNSLGKDVCVYLGGNDRIGDFFNATAQGLANQPGRHVWCQMVDDVYPIQDPYDGSRHARVFCFIHELGHSRGACHEQAYTTPITRQSTVMDTNYLGSTFTHWDFSSPLYNGDENHDNAKFMRQNKSDPRIYSS